MMKFLNIDIRNLVISASVAGTAFLSGCTFQPLYSSPDGSVANSFAQLSNISVAKVDTREAQQVRNHLIFLLSGGISPMEPSHEVRLRVSKNNSSNATTANNVANSTIDTTAGSVSITVSYDIYNFSKKSVQHSGRRVASAAYDKTSQSFSNERAIRDAENRAAKEVAEQVRLAIASQISNN